MTETMLFCPRFSFIQRSVIGHTTRIFRAIYLQREGLLGPAPVNVNCNYVFIGSELDRKDFLGYLAVSGAFELSGVVRDGR